MLVKAVLEKALYPVWYSESFWFIKIFCVKVKNRLAMYLYIGIPPFKAPLPNILDPNTTWYKSLPIILVMAIINLGVY